MAGQELRLQRPDGCLFTARGNRLLVVDTDAAPDGTGRLRRWLAEVDEVFEGATGGTYDREWLLRPIRQMQPEDYRTN